MYNITSISFFSMCPKLVISNGGFRMDMVIAAGKSRKKCHCIHTYSAWHQRGHRCAPTLSWCCRCPKDEYVHVCTDACRHSHEWTLRAARSSGVMSRNSETTGHYVDIFAKICSNSVPSKCTFIATCSSVNYYLLTYRRSRYCDHHVCLYRSVGLSVCLSVR